MALSMSRPWKHPKTGVYWLRKRVPDDLRPVLGKLEEKQSLKTKDPSEAKRRHAEALIAVETQWSNLRAGPQTVSEREAHELVAGLHDWWIAQHHENPTEQRLWRTDLFDRLWAVPPFDPANPFPYDDDTLKVSGMQHWCAEQADGLIRCKGLVVDETGRRRIARAIASAVQRASLVLQDMAKGLFAEPSPSLVPATPPLLHSTRVNGVQASVSFDELFKGWVKEKQPAEKTKYEWERVLKQFKAFVGHDDAARVTPDDLISWKAAQLEAGLRPKTIRDAKIGAVRAIFRWGVDNRKLASNPAERITMDVKAKAADLKRSFTDEEAAIVLRAALEETDPVRRWIPWLCAYSGARVAEVSQLRREDVFQADGIWCLKFDPDAGSLKTRGSERAVPIHPAVIDSGFLKYVEKVGKGPLFPGLPPNRFGSRGGNGTKVVGRWVRSLGLEDTRLAPNHSWRHRLKTLGRRYGLAPDIVNAITGHSRKNVADSYGEYEMTALDRELRKIPALKLEKVAEGKG
ncbi:MAG TPA: site-specific integrase [Mesorhizobium sp.]|jgi:integrase|nr:site-specific integrase [Mesorhizobium sp.]